MAHSPLAQFKINKFIDINLLGMDLSITNSSLFMILTSIIIVTVFAIPIRYFTIVPRGTFLGIQNISEVICEFVQKTLTDITGGTNYFPFVFSLFIFVLFSNLIGMFPYSFTTTSHISVTFSLAIFIFITVTIIGFLKHGLKFLSFFLPSGTPKWLAPLMILIELFAYLARPVSLSIRLAANMIAGHILLKVLAGFVLLMGVWGWLPIPFMVIFTGFEIFVAILQAYIFTILVCVYLNDAINLH